MVSRHCFSDSRLKTAVVKISIFFQNISIMNTIFALHVLPKLLKFHCKINKLYDKNTSNYVCVTCFLNLSIFKFGNRGAGDSR